MAELTTDDGSTASPEAIRRFEERNNAVPDQTTDHLDEAVEAAAEAMFTDAPIAFRFLDGYLRQAALDKARRVIETPEVATYYEDKGAEKLRKRIQREAARIEESTARTLDGIEDGGEEPDDAQQAEIDLNYATVAILAALGTK